MTNTRTNTVAVYDAANLTLLKQFPNGTITHSRDAIYDPVSNRVFISSASEGSSGDGLISVFDAVTLEKIQDVATGARIDYSPMSLAVDNGILVSPSLTSNKVAKIDTQTLTLSFVTITGINVGGRGASGIAFDADANRLYIASQNSDELVIADATTGETLAEVPTGAGALNVALDPVNQLALRHQLRGHLGDRAGDQRHEARQPPDRARQPCVDRWSRQRLRRGQEHGKQGLEDHGRRSGGGCRGHCRYPGARRHPGNGGLTLSVSDATVDLGTAELNASATAYEATGTLPTVTVADVRSAQVGWSLVGQAGDFTFGAESFSGSTLGWTPKVLTTGDGQTVTAGGARTTGLDQGSALASSPAGASRGTATVSADLGLSVPTTVPPGRYVSVLTLTLS